MSVEAPPRPEVTGPDDANRGERPRRGRTVFFVLSTLVILFAPFYVQATGSIQYSPGFSTSTAPLVDIAATDRAGEIDGEFRLLAVHVSVPTLAEVVRARFDQAIELVARSRVIPPGVANRDYFAAQRQDFSDVFQVAAAVGLQRAGLDVEVDSSVGVSQVMSGGPSDGVLQPGDRIVGVAGADGDGDVVEGPVSTMDDLIDALRGLDDGEALTLTVLRVVDGPDALGPDLVDADPSTDVVEQSLELDVRAALVEAIGRPGIGISGETLVGELELPFPVELDNARGIGGPSAGLVFGLTVYDLVSAEDLADGRQVHATGTLDRDGRVGPIGGIRQKVFSSAREGADLLLVPSSQFDDAQAVAPPDLEVIGVATIDEAIEALRR